MTKLNRDQMIQAADELGDAIRKWKLVEGRGEFLVFRVPDLATGQPSSNEGEQMRFWRFDVRHAAERFRNRKIVAELASLTEGAAA